MPTIAKNATRKIAGLKPRLTTCRVYTLANNFHGNPVDPRFAWDALTRNRHGPADRVRRRHQAHRVGPLQLLV